MVQREVVRLVTPGTLTEEALLDARASNILAALGRAGGGFRAGRRRHVHRRLLRWRRLNEGEIAAELARVAPRELLVPDGLLADETHRRRC